MSSSASLSCRAHNIRAGPLISRAAVQMMADAVSDALHRGGHKLFAGRQLRQHSLPAKGFWCQPVLLSLVKSNWSAMRWVREEGPFGPLLAVLPVTDWREAAQHMAAGAHALAVTGLSVVLMAGQ